MIKITVLAVIINPAMKFSQKPMPAKPCPIDYAFQRIGGKYKARILWNIHENEVLRYGELKRIIYGVTPKMLTQTLRELEHDNLINRHVYTEVPPKVEYTLTETGESIIPFIGHLLNWAVGQMGIATEDIPVQH
jgi:DNA-binding HxlR family transcriptional regulator